MSWTRLPFLHVEALIVKLCWLLSFSLENTDLIGFIRIFRTKPVINLPNPISQ